MAIIPLHAATIRGRRLRFYRTPLNDGRLDLPWHSVDDLQRIIGLNRTQREAMLKFHTRSEFGIEPVATIEGIVAIAPDYVAQGFISAMSELFGNTDDVERAYVKASYEAARKLTDGLQDAEFFSWAMVAIERHETDAA